jgi:hypothetical protein
MNETIHSSPAHKSGTFCEANRSLIMNADVGPEGAIESEHQAGEHGSPGAFTAALGGYGPGQFRSALVTIRATGANRDTVEFRDVDPSLWHFQRALQPVTVARQGNFVMSAACRTRSGVVPPGEEELGIVHGRRSQKHTTSISRGRH